MRINNFVMKIQQQSVASGTTVRIRESLNKLPYIVLISEVILLCEQIPLTCQVMQLKVSNISFRFLLRRSNFICLLSLCYILYSCVLGMSNIHLVPSSHPPHLSLACWVHHHLWHQLRYDEFVMCGYINTKYGSILNSTFSTLDHQL